MRRELVEVNRETSNLLSPHTHYGQPITLCISMISSFKQNRSIYCLGSQKIPKNILANQRVFYQMNTHIGQTWKS